MYEALNILIVGVGGQGNILFSKILGSAFLNLGFDVKISEVHGMAQRGGSVVTYVRIGEKVYSPLIDKNQADFIIAFEKLEALRWIEYLKTNGKVLLSDYEIPPLSVISGAISYPDVISIFDRLNINYYKVDIPSILKEIKNPRVQNTIMLGYFSNFLNIDSKVLIDSIKRNVKPEILDINLKAFELGQRYKIKG